MSTQNIPRTKTTLNLQVWDFSKGLKNEFETALVNEPSVFEPLKFYCKLGHFRKKKRCHFHFASFLNEQILFFKSRSSLQYRWQKNMHDTLKPPFV